MKRPPIHSMGNRSLSLDWAFTVLELLTVMAIIAVLAGLILAGAGYAQQKAARDRARAEIAALGAALENFKADQGEYPVGAANSGTDSSIRLYSALTNGTYFYDASDTGKYVQVPVYFEYRKDMTGTASGSLFYMDPFGNSYNYRRGDNANAVNKGSYDLWSTAGTGTTTSATAQAKWITNWN